MYPSTPTLSVDSVQVRSVVVCVVPDAVNVVGADGAVVSGTARVVTAAVLLAADKFPAASFAFTVNAYVVEAVNPVTS